MRRKFERTQKPSVELTISAVRKANSFWRRGAWPLALAAWLSGARPATPLRGAETDVRCDATVAAVEKLMPSVVNIATIEIVARGTECRGAPAARRVRSNAAGFHSGSRSLTDFFMVECLTF